MSKQEIDDFSDDSIAEIAKFVRKLRWQVQNVEELARAVKRHRPTHEIRTGVTAPRTGEEYPSSGCVLPVQFTSLAFNESGADACEPLEKTLWSGKFVSARTMGGGYIAEGEDVLIVKTAGMKGRRWWIISAGLAGTISFTMLSDRTRETKDGAPIGYAQVRIDQHVGSIPDDDSDEVQVVFADSRWYGAVTGGMPYVGCQGIADYADGSYIVKECQELAAGFWFITLEDRSYGAGPQDVKVEVVSLVAHGNCDFHPELWKIKGSPEVDCGFIRYTWLTPAEDPGGIGEWSLQSGFADNFDGCCLQSYNSYLIPPPADINQSGQTIDVSKTSPSGISIYGPGGPNLTPGPTCDPPSEVTLEVRYEGGTFPRMVKGAIGFASFDNAIGDKDTNENMRYSVIVSDELPETIKGTLLSNVCKVDFGVNTATEMSEWKHGQKIPLSMFPLSIANNMHAGKTGNVWVAEWDKLQKRYLCVSIEHHRVVGLVGYTVSQDGDCYTVTASKQPMYVELCEEAEPITLETYRIAEVNRVKELTMDDDEEGAEGYETCPSPLLGLELYTEYVKVACPDPSVRVTTLPLSSEYVTVDVFDDTSCINQTQVQLITFGRCGTEREDEIICDDDFECP